MLVIDPRYTRTAAHADHFVQIRPGTDVGIIWGMLWHIFENEWEDKEYIRQRVYGMDEIRAGSRQLDAGRNRAGHRCARRCR